MFSQASVILSTGGVSQHALGGEVSATAVDGTHPTGMYSCTGRDFTRSVNLPRDAFLAWYM